MKLLGAALVAGAAQAIDYNYNVYGLQDAFIPYDCYGETNRLYGAQKGNYLSDRTLMTGLDAYKHKLTKVTACVDQCSQKVQGVMTTWAKWVDGEQTDVKRLNIIGKMSGLYYYDDSVAYAAAGVTVPEEADTHMQLYWFQEASPLFEQMYAVNRFEGRLFTDAWRTPRQEMFGYADLDGSGSLNEAEAKEFLRKVREYDGKYRDAGDTIDHNVLYERVDRHWKACTKLAGTPDSMTFADYENLEKITNAWFEDDKLTATGWVSDEIGTSKLNGLCSNLDIDEDDRVVHAGLRYTNDGVTSLVMQTVKTPEWSVSGSGYTEAYEQDEYFRFGGDDGDFAGFWGVTDAEDGKVEGLGFIIRDSKCT